MAFRLEMRGIKKQFDRNVVLKGVDFAVQPGEIHALIGENGAGKSTLMNILGGVLRPDAGEIRLDGSEKHFDRPVDSMAAGVAFIHQELNLINDLTVYENMFIGRELKKGMFLDHAEMIRRTAEIFKRIDMKIDPRTYVRELDASYKQIVEIARAMMMNANVIIMDEPTTSLTEPEIERVFDMMRTLAKQGVSIVFISHKLNEVLSFCDSYTVLRDGEMVHSAPTAGATANELAYYMVGHEVTGAAHESSDTFGRDVLTVESAVLEPYFRNVSFNVRAGQVLGFTGLLGDGRSELFRAVFGDLSLTSGTVKLEGKTVNIRSTRQAYRMGIGYVPRDRKENGIIKDMSILENGSLVTLQESGLLLDHAKIRESFESRKKELRVKMGANSDLITSLSGGNQQKVVLAKWLSAKPRVLIFDNPTQGVDVGAKEEIYNIIRELASNGVAIVILSSEAQEIMRLCDRALVLFHGTVMGELTREEMNEQSIMLLATGGTVNKEEN